MTFFQSELRVSSWERRYVHTGSLPPEHKIRYFNVRSKAEGYSQVDLPSKTITELEKAPTRGRTDHFAAGVTY